jgi:parvulin-like peptidyl-prolyl isomerase
MKRIISKIRRKNKITKKPEEPKLAGRITNDNVAEHREEVIGDARKKIYPLRHSKNRLVTISISVFLVALVVFVSYCTLALYKFKQNSVFLHNVTRVIPFPIARIGSDFVSYEDYLFEINHYVHYYEAQQEVDFASESGKSQLEDYKKRALEKVIDDAYTKRLAEQKGISVSDREVDDEIAIIRSQNRLGGSEREFEDILKDFWNWSVDDFKRSLKQQLLSQKVASALDIKAHEKADNVYTKLESGTDFGKLAKQMSEDPSTKDNKGEYGFMIEKTNRDISPKTVNALFALKPGQYSEPVDVGYGLEIVKNIEKKGNKIRAAHIVINFKNINGYLNDLKEQQQTRTYVKF